MNAKAFFSLCAKILLGLALAAIIVFAILKWRDIFDLVKSPEHVKAWLAGLGALAPLAFILIQFLQVVVFIIPGEVPQVAGGYFFGIPMGILLSLIGIGAGSAFAFFAARILGLAFVFRLFGKKNVDRFETFISSERAQVAFFLFFLIPGIPKDILCYVGGISKLRWWNFLLISMVGRLPALTGSVLIGNAAASQNWTVFIVIIVLASILFICGIVFRTRIFAWIERILGRRPAGSGTSADSAGPEQGGPAPISKDKDPEK